MSFSFYESLLIFFPSAKYTSKFINFLGKKRKLAITILSVAVSLFLLSLLAYMWLMKKKKKKVKKIICIALFMYIYMCVPLSHEKCPIYEESFRLGLHCEIIVSTVCQYVYDSEEKITQSIIKFYWYQRLFGGK